MIGVERERNCGKGRQTMGVRSFLLLSLLGAIASGIDQPFVSLGIFSFVGGAIVVGYMRTTLQSVEQNTVGLTTEIAAMATFGLGYFTNHEPFLCLALGVLVLTILHNKPAMHNFIRKRLTTDELQAAVILLLLSVGVIPLLPDSTIDPLHIFNPRLLAVIIALIAGIQFFGYAVSRIFGSRIGRPLSGFFAGIISSTAVYALYPRIVKDEPQNAIAFASAAMFANAATLSKLAILLAVVSWRLVYAITIPLTLTIAASFIAGFALSYKDGSVNEQSLDQSPLNLVGAIKLGALLTALIFVVELSERILGTSFAMVIAFMGALFELHGVAIASANMTENGATSLSTGAITVMLAITASHLSKVALTAFLAEGSYRRIVVAIMTVLLAISAATLLLIAFVPGILLQSN